MFKQKSSAGFTLIELIVVVCLLGILLAYVSGRGSRNPYNVQTIGIENTENYKCVNNYLVKKTGSTEKELHDKNGARVPCTPR